MELGNYFQKLNPLSSRVNSFMREALESEQVDIFNLASEDLNLVKGLSMGDLEATDVISSNLVPPAEGGFDYLKKYFIEERPIGNGDSIRIAFLGIADPRLVKPNSGFTAVEPLDALEPILPKVKKQSDIIMVIGEMSEVTADRIAEAFPEVSVVLRSERSFRLTKPRQVNNAMIMSSVERGRMLGRVSLVLSQEKKVTSYTYKYIDLNNRVSEDSALASKARSVLN